MPALIQGYSTTSAVQGNKVVKVREWHALSEPSETYFQFQEPLLVNRDAAQLRADQVSDIIETLLERPDITDVVWSQDVTPGGRLHDIWTVYWQTVDTARDGWVEVRYSEFSPGFVEGAVANDIAAGG